MRFGGRRYQHVHFADRMTTATKVGADDGISLSHGRVHHEDGQSPDQSRFKVVALGDRSRPFDAVTDFRLGND